MKQCNSTGDGSEIRRSPVELGGLSHYLQGLKNHPRWLALGFLNHQQYDTQLHSQLKPTYTLSLSLSYLSIGAAVWSPFNGAQYSTSKICGSRSIAAGEDGTQSCKRCTRVCALSDPSDSTGQRKDVISLSMLD